MFGEWLRGDIEDCAVAYPVTIAECQLQRCTGHAELYLKSPVVRACPNKSLLLD
jgi:hypothetical protein